MMRHPADQSLPRFIEPWLFARSRRIVSGAFDLHQSQELKAWAEADKPMQVYIEGYCDNDNKAYLKGQLKVSLSLTCQRCLQAMQWQADLPFDYLLLRSEAQEEQIEDGRETLVCADEEIDLAWFLEEEVLLAMPMIAKHDNCQLPIEQSRIAQTEAEAPQSPFAQLKDLMNNKE